MWPFTKRTEDRASYTDAAIAQILADAGGQGTLDHRNLSAAQTAAAATGRALAAATVKGADTRRTGFTSAVLYDIGCALMLDGEGVFMIEVSSGGAVMLTRASDHEIIGGPDPASWRYRVTLAGPTRNRQLNVPGETIFHPRVNMAPQQPHKGRSPFDLPGDSVRMAAGLERLLADEAGAPSGFVLPYPEKVSALDAIKSDLAKARGRTQLVPSMSKSWEGARAGAPSDWKPQRLGFNPPAEAAKIRESLFGELLAVAGIPVAMFAAGARAEGKREALRQWLHTALEPLSEVIETEARDKLSAEVSFDFTALNASDIQGRARAFQSLVAGGMPLEQAAAASGILTPEDAD